MPPLIPRLGSGSSLGRIARLVRIRQARALPCSRTPLVHSGCRRSTSGKCEERSDSQHFHSGVGQRQAVQVSQMEPALPAFTSTHQHDLVSILTQAEDLFSSSSIVTSWDWARRLRNAKQRWIEQDQRPSSVASYNRVLLTGSSSSQIQRLITSMVDEPLREDGNVDVNEAQVLSDILKSLPTGTPLTIRYAPGRLQQPEPGLVTLDRHWLQQSNLELVVLVDTSASEATYDLVYDTQAAFFVTDDYALSRSLRQSTAYTSQGDTARELMSRFAAKPNVYVVVNSVAGLGSSHVEESLEAYVGSAAADALSPRALMVSASDAAAAHEAFRQALSRGSEASTSTLSDSAAHWDDFSSRYRRSNISSIISALQGLDKNRGGSRSLLMQSTAFLLQHCADEAHAKIRSTRAQLDELRYLAVEVTERDEQLVQRSMERVWPSSSTFTGQLGRESIKVWRPASPGSMSAVDETLHETTENLESTFDKRLQWWKIVWKVDDIRAELEAACGSFAKALESDLAYESGRLATMQVHGVDRAEALLEGFRKNVKDMPSITEDAAKEAALLSNEADAFRSSKLKSIEPSTLMAPIERRRAQLLETGGPIDTLATKTRNLAVMTSAAAILTTTGIGSATMLGSSLAFDASASTLALDPSTGLGLALLTFTLAGWRLQGQYNRYRRKFRQDWDRLGEGLDQELKSHFEVVLKEQITGPSRFASSKILELVRNWSADVHRLDERVRKDLRDVPSMQASSHFDDPTLPTSPPASTPGNQP